MALHPPAAERGSSAALDARLAELFDAHADFVSRALLRLGVPSADVEDSLQEVFLVVARRLDSDGERGAMRAWRFVITRPGPLHVLRARRRRPPEAPEPISIEDPHASLVHKEAISFVNRFLEELDERLAQAFYLAEIEQFTAPEISAALGVNLSTVY